MATSTMTTGIKIHQGRNSPDGTLKLQTGPAPGSRYQFQFGNAPETNPVELLHELRIINLENIRDSKGQHCNIFPIRPELYDSYLTKIFTQNENPDNYKILLLTQEDPKEGPKGNGWLKWAALNNTTGKLKLGSSFKKSISTSSPCSEAIDTDYKIHRSEILTDIKFWINLRNILDVYYS